MSGDWSSLIAEAWVICPPLQWTLWLLGGPEPCRILGGGGLCFPTERRWLGRQNKVPSYKHSVFWILFMEQYFLNKEVRWSLAIC